VYFLIYIQQRNAESMLQQYAGAPAISQSTETLASDTQSDCENYAYKKVRERTFSYTITSSVFKNYSISCVSYLTLSHLVL